MYAKWTEKRQKTIKFILIKINCTFIRVDSLYKMNEWMRELLKGSFRNGHVWYSNDLYVSKTANMATFFSYRVQPHLAHHTTFFFISMHDTHFKIDKIDTNKDKE